MKLKLILFVLLFFGSMSLVFSECVEGDPDYPDCLGQTDDEVTSDDIKKNPKKADSVSTENLVDLALEDSKLVGELEEPAKSRVAKQILSSTDLMNNIVDKMPEEDTVEILNENDGENLETAVNTEGGGNVEVEIEGENIPKVTGRTSEGVLTFEPTQKGDIPLTIDIRSFAEVDLEVPVTITAEGTALIDGAVLTGEISYGCASDSGETNCGIIQNGGIFKALENSHSEGVSFIIDSETKVETSTFTGQCIEEHCSLSTTDVGSTKVDGSLEYSAWQKPKIVYKSEGSIELNMFGFKILDDSVVTEFETITSETSTQSSLNPVARYKVFKGQEEGVNVGVVADCNYLDNCIHYNKEESIFESNAEFGFGVGFFGNLPKNVLINDKSLTLGETIIIGELDSLGETTTYARISQTKNENGELNPDVKFSNPKDNWDELELLKVGNFEINKVDEYVISMGESSIWFGKTCPIDGTRNCQIGKYFYENLGDGLFKAGDGNCYLSSGGVHVSCGDTSIFLDSDGKPCEGNQKCDLSSQNAFFEGGTDATEVSTQLALAYDDIDFSFTGKTADYKFFDSNSWSCAGVQVGSKCNMGNSAYEAISIHGELFFLARDGERFDSEGFLVNRDGERITREDCDPNVKNCVSSSNQAYFKNGELFGINSNRDSYTYISKDFEGNTDELVLAFSNKLGINPNKLYAIIETETGSLGAMKDGYPSLRFECQIFNRMSSSGVSCANDKYEYGNADDTNLGAFLRALEVDREVALKSTSFGLGQIMGWDYDIAGYDSPDEMYDAAFSETEQVKMMLNYLANDDPAILAELQKDDSDWGTISYHYNGEGYAVNRYDEKLKNYFNDFESRKSGDELLADTEDLDLEIVSNLDLTDLEEIPAMLE